MKFEISDTYMFINAIFVCHIIAQISRFNLEKKHYVLLMMTQIIGSICSNRLFVSGYEILGVLSAGRIVKLIYMSVLFFIIGRFAVGGITRMVLSVLFTDIINALVEMITSRICYCLSSYVSDYVVFYSDNYGVAQLIVELLVGLVICIVPTKLYRKMRDIPFENHMVSRILALGYLIIGYVFLSKQIITLEQSESRLMSYMVFFCILVVVMAILILQQENRLYRQTNRQMFLQEQLQREYVQLLEEQTALTRKFRHDIRKHLDMVSYIRSNDAYIQGNRSLKTYENNLLEMCRELTTGDYCSCSEVNAVFYQLEKYCQKNGIDFHASIRNVSFDVVSGRGELLAFLNGVNWMMVQCARLQEQRDMKMGGRVEISGVMLKGINTLNLILRCKEMEEKEPFRRNRFKKDILEEYVRTIRKCLKASGGMADVFEEKGERRLTICWSQQE